MNQADDQQQQPHDWDQSGFLAGPAKRKNSPNTPLSGDELKLIHHVRHFGPATMSQLELCKASWLSRINLESTLTKMSHRHADTSGWKMVLLYARKPSP